MDSTLSLNCTTDASWQNGVAGVAASCFIYKEAASDWEGLLYICTAAFQIYADNHNVAELRATELALELADRAMQHLHINVSQVRHLEVVSDSQCNIYSDDSPLPRYLHGIPVEYKWNPRRDSSIRAVDSRARAVRMGFRPQGWGIYRIVDARS